MNDYIDPERIFSPSGMTEELTMLDGMLSQEGPYFIARTDEDRTYDIVKRIGWKEPDYQRVARADINHADRDRVLTVYDEADGDVNQAFRRWREWLDSGDILNSPTV
ncbi:MAG: hypothetical protein SVW02_00765 [Candidatus Nanohaloarchaea archaeon]|nr:hypothetical protein [Candidatus Nanohaloarchaea archaeon]